MRFDSTHQLRNGRRTRKDYSGNSINPPSAASSRWSEANPVEAS
ncbi:hypothetical protein HMPREF9595_01937 [Cutibacterium acnes HL005PA2]|nr:hypothetical protein HMPREF9575_00296 [Cutibacterium acnes HL110PA1]EFS59889.1 hypothetical protein HMPREF9604_00151 [Cutibacterium acnes HL036PA1]EFS61305.1 hypothetical protein HMPREF9605_01139 [Cutibacterium acnes HL036PA2]EFS67309.1 hypothetical protein HMPREF9612_00295 [Cutibacterium acnes HL063PA2]EFS98757.1 hypothetical protein HMPREF9609_02540 [Cutibacterium acnes HL027PA1]EFT06168.1 hypothetical protein HMPREF9614_00190 [Cutibacterium acnes HL002PA2]EFT07746.1 hypothetical protein